MAPSTLEQQQEGRPSLSHMDSSFSNYDEDFVKPVIYTAEELGAMREVKAKLLMDHGIVESRIGLAFLAVATINCKLRVEEAVKKIKKFLDMMALLGCPEGIDNELWKPEAAHELKSYEPCGKDFKGSSMIWINSNGRKVEEDEQRFHVHACIMHFLAVHADAVSLRQGITMVIDVSVSPKGRKVGNEKEIQGFYQAFPQRPQAIMIAGTTRVTRMVVNASIKVASLFTKQKVLDRIQFVSIEEAKHKVPLSSAPRYVGGQGGGVESTVSWVYERLENFPIPEL